MPTDDRPHLPSPRLAAAAERLPVVLAVTGHRDPADPTALAGEVAALLTELDAIAPHSPFLVLSPLAEGADRIFARACLDFRGRRRLWRHEAGVAGAAGAFPRRTLLERLRGLHPTADPAGGVSLIAPLPMPQAEYEHDFTAPGSLEEFRALLAKADATFDLPLAPGCTLEALRSERTSDPHRFGGPLRDRQYQRLGLFIAVQSSLVVACWNGLDPKRPGGAARRGGADGEQPRHQGDQGDGLRLPQPADPQRSACLSQRLPFRSQDARPTSKSRATNLRASARSAQGSPPARWHPATRQQPQGSTAVAPPRRWRGLPRALGMPVCQT